MFLLLFESLVSEGDTAGDFGHVCTVPCVFCILA